MRLSGETKTVSLFLTIIICASCAREAYNISYKGVIVDEETNCPLPFSAVQSFCLYQQNIDRSETQQLNTVSDSLGYFHLKFDKGYKISLAVEAEDYVEQYLQFKPYSSHKPDTIYLKRKLIFQSSTAKNPSNY